MNYYLRLLILLLSCETSTFTYSEETAICNLQIKIASKLSEKLDFTNQKNYTLLSVTFENHSDKEFIIKKLCNTTYGKAYLWKDNEDHLSFEIYSESGKKQKPVIVCGYGSKSTSVINETFYENFSIPRKSNYTIDITINFGSYLLKKGNYYLKIIYAGKIYHNNIEEQCYIESNNLNFEITEKNSADVFFNSMDSLVNSRDSLRRDRR